MAWIESERRGRYLFEKCGDRALFLAWWREHLGGLYLYGGRGDVWTGGGKGKLTRAPYPGWDCLGGVGCALLASGGPDIRSWWTDVAWLRLEPVATPEPGDLIFWAPAEPRGPEDVEHVEVVLGRATTPLVVLAGTRRQLLPGWRTIGAAGGNRTTVTRAIARRQSACIRERSHHLLRPYVAGFRRLPLEDRR